MRKVATFKARYLDNGHLSIPEEVATSLLLKRGEEVRVMIEKEKFDREGFLGLFGVSLDNIIAIAEGLVGTFALITLVINVLKWAGVVNDGAAGKWSAVANLFVLLVVTVVFKLYPDFNFGGVDEMIAEFAKVAGIVFAYIIQIIGSKRVHLAVTRGLNVRAWSHTMQLAYKY